MSQSQATEEHAELTVESIGGIDTTEISLSPGVTSLTGRNATNRTSLLQALMATLGSEAVSLKGDADHGEVILTIGDDTYTRTLDRRNGTVVFDGDPYLEDTEAAELFGFLLESNEARQAVARDDDLREVIMRPVDTAAIQAEIEQLEAEAVEEFNDHMETILGVLDYANIERIWIERTEQTVREGRRKVKRGVFDLHVIRSTEEGTTYEDAISHLSESEREVTGLVFALAGYLVHDLHESLPFIMVNSLEALDSDRIAALVEYFGEYAAYLVVALLPEDAAALDEDYQRVTEI